MIPSERIEDGTRHNDEKRPGEPAAAAPPEPAARPHPARVMSPKAPALAAEIAAALGETEPQPMEQITCAVDRLGTAQARAFLAQVQEIEAGGGRMLPDGSRCRTSGVLFFLLVCRSANVSRRDRPCSACPHWHPYVCLYSHTPYCTQEYLAVVFDGGRDITR